MKRARPVIGVVTMAVSLIGLVGCGGGKNFSPEDFKKVQPGMSADQVQDILGRPFDSADAVGIKRLWWKVGDNYYSASFKDAKVEEAEGPSKKDDYEFMKALMKGAKDQGVPPAPREHATAVQGEGVGQPTQPGQNAGSSFFDAKGEATIKVPDESGMQKVAFSPDGKLLASGDQHGIVRFMDTATGKEVRSIKAHEREVYCVAFARDAGVFVSGGDDNLAKVWEPGTGKEISILKGHESRVRHVAITPDGKTVVTASTDGKIKIWDAVTGKERATYDPGEYPSVPGFGADDVAISADGKVFVVAISGIYMRDTNTGKILQHITPADYGARQSRNFWPSPLMARRSRPALLWMRCCSSGNCRMRSQSLRLRPASLVSPPWRSPRMERSLLPGARTASPGSGTSRPGNSYSPLRKTSSARSR